MKLVKLTHLILFLFSYNMNAGENAAPSSHMVYNDANFAGDTLINDVRVPAKGEAMFTYYETLGWAGKAAGYAGIQAHPRGHNYIFSIWDHKEHKAPIKAIYQGPGTLVENFGGEGTGLKSWNFKLGWDTDVWYTLVARCWPINNHTFYGYWVKSGKTNQWTHMVTMEVAAKNAYMLGGNDSFIEDWLETGKVPRTTHIRNGWKRKPTGEWHAFQKAKYSVNSWDLVKGKRSFNFKKNWDGGIAEDSTGKYYYMTSGGSKTSPTTENPSEFKIKRDIKKPNQAPIKIISASAKQINDQKVLIEWEHAPNTSPQFSYGIQVIQISNKKEETITSISKIEPHVRKSEIVIPDSVTLESIEFRIQCFDIFDNKSNLLNFRL